MWSSIRKNYGKWKWKPFHEWTGKMTDCSFQKKGSYLSLNAVTNERYLKGAIARALLWRAKKEEAKTLYFWVYSGAPEKDKHSWERASQSVAGTTVVLLRAAACLVQWEGSSSQCQPSIWAPRTFQPKRQEHPALRDCPRMHLVPNMKRHLKKHLDHEEIKEAVQ